MDESKGSFSNRDPGFQRLKSSGFNLVVRGGGVEWYTEYCSANNNRAELSVQVYKQHVESMTKLIVLGVNKKNNNFVVT